MAVQRDILIVSTEGIKERFRSKVTEKLTDAGWTLPKGGTIYSHEDHPHIGIHIVETSVHYGYSIYLGGFGIGDILWTWENNIDQVYDILVTRLKDYEEEYAD